MINFKKFLILENDKIGLSIPNKVVERHFHIKYEDDNGNVKDETITIPVANALQKNSKTIVSFDVNTDCARGCPGCYVDTARKIGCNVKAKYQLCEYRGELGKKIFNNDKIRNEINKLGGIRMFSGGDYIPSHLPENSYYKKLKEKNPTEYNREAAIQKLKHDFANEQIKAFLDDAKKYGFRVKTITKEPEFIQNHAFHDAIETINLSMNKHDFGFSHDQVKEIKKSLGDMGHKIKGRVMVFSPIDIHDLLKEKDKSHIGIVTSGHNFSKNGILLSPKNPNDRHGIQTIFIQKNFPEKVKNFLNGEDVPIHEVLKKLNEYNKEYNKIVNDVRNKIIKKEPITITEYYMLKDPTNEKNNDNKEKTGEHDTLKFVNGKWQLIHHSPKGILDIKAEKERQRKEFLAKKKEEKSRFKNIQEALEKEDVHEIVINDNIDLDLKTFDKINPISPDFEEKDLLELAKHLKDKMCCYGGSCQTCTTKCASKKDCEENITESFLRFIKNETNDDFYVYENDMIHY